ncbi:MAG: hypothetical protein PHO76_01930 [Methylotenera sp.]|nr:hypothetical protein [Methylotenera sp.]MDD4925542.1 hypothetical protein [Methylotenera sp.]NOU40949.1 hypothetical protein [Methylotenera sp.]
MKIWPDKLKPIKYKFPFGLYQFLVSPQNIPAEAGYSCEKPVEGVKSMRISTTTGISASNPALQGSLTKSSMQRTSNIIGPKQ